jgi:polysaccharide biosynthesis transport protein
MKNAIVSYSSAVEYSYSAFDRLSYGLRSNALLIAVNGAILASGLAAWTLLPRTYESSFDLVVPQSLGGVSTRLDNVDSITQEQAQFTAQIDPRKLQKQILTSEAVLNRVKSPEGKPLDSSAIKIKLEDVSNLINVKVTAPSPQLAQDAASQLLIAYRTRVEQLRQEGLQDRSMLYQKPLLRATAELKKAEAELLAFQNQSGLVASNEQLRTTLEAISTLINAQVTALAAQQEAEARFKSLGSRLGMAPEQAVGSLRLSSYAPYIAARSELDQVERELTEARALFTEENPKVRDLLNRRSELQSLVKERVREAGNSNSEGSLDPTRMELIGQMITAEAEAKAQREGAANIKKRIDQMEAGVSRLGQSNVELLRHQRRLLVAETTYKSLISQVQKANLDMANQYPSVQVINVPNLNKKPTTPSDLVVAGSTAMAAFLASTALLVGKRRRNPAFVEADLGSVDAPPILAKIPYGHPVSAIHFHMLGTLLLKREDLEVLLVTSSTEGEGKSFTAANLALALREMGATTLLVHADYSRMVQSQQPLLPMDRDPDAPCPGQVRVRSAASLERLLARVKGSYRFVIVDTGPIQVAPDAVALLRIVPDILFVIRPGVVPVPLVINSINFLRQLESRLVGCVLNGTKDLTMNTVETYRRYS